MKEWAKNETPVKEKEGGKRIKKRKNGSTIGEISSKLRKAVHNAGGTAPVSTGLNKRNGPLR